MSAHVLLNLLNELRKSDKMRGLPLEAVAGYTQLWLIPGSQKIKGDECSDSAIPRVNSLAIWLEWSTVTQEFWVRILVDPKYFPF